MAGPCLNILRGLQELSLLKKKNIKAFEGIFCFFKSFWVLSKVCAFCGCSLESFIVVRTEVFAIDALEVAHNLGMSYYKALIHQWIGLSMDIRDTQKDVQMKLRHKDTAMEMFISLGVNDSALLW
jgi:hypothetical protein